MINYRASLFRSAISIACAVPVLVASSGCIAVVAGAAAGAGTVAYVRGELETTVGKPFDTVDHATNSALTNLRFMRLSEKKDALLAHYEVRTAEDKKVTIKVSRVTDQLTRVDIRVGLFGNESLSRTIMDRIQAEL